MKRKATPSKGAQKKIPAKSKPQAATKKKPEAKPPVKVKPKASAKSSAKVSAKKSLKSAVKSAAKSAVKSAKSSGKSLKKSLKATVKKAVGMTQPKTASKAVKTKVAAQTGKTTQKPASSKGSGLVKKVVKGLKAALRKITPAKKAAAKAPVKAPVAVKAAAKSAVRKTPSKTLRPKAFPARDAEKAFGFSAGVPELPESYGEDRLVLMTQDPEYLHAYWEITPVQYAASEAAKREGEEYREALRLNWVARDLFAPNFALLPVTLTARKAYLRVPYSGLSYQVEIGWVSEQGHFISILGRSNRSDAPESWKQTRQRLQKDAGERSVLEYNLSITQPLGSSELGRTGTLSTEERTPALAGDWNFEGPGALSSSASSGAAVKKTPPAALAAKPPKRRR
jgi:hypothetical protein